MPNQALRKTVYIFVNNICKKYLQNSKKIRSKGDQRQHYKD